MALIDYVTSKRPDRPYEVPDTNEMHLLKALLHLLLYIGETKAPEEFKKLLYISGESMPNKIAPKQLVNMG